MEVEKKIQEQIDLIPARTGVYKFYDEIGELLYIGKALNLRSRVMSYFRDTHLDRPHIISMIPRINSIETIETDGEVEALVLESALIKQKKPPYNILHKDDKSYAYIFISTHEKIPLVKVVRPTKNDKYTKGRLFGPYPKGRGIRQVFRYIRKLYPFCTCVNPKEPCLYFHMGQCQGPHFGYVTREEYMESISEIIKFLEGKKKRHVSAIENKMKLYAREQKFEQAAILRNQIDDLKHLGNRINVTYNSSEEDFKERRTTLLKGELLTIGENLGINTPTRIECYDISNIQGTHAYGSMVVAVDGKPESSQYRAFKIRENDTPNDFAMLAEVLRRRIAHIGKNPDDSSLNAKPDMILIDGGKGQLSAVSNLIPEGVFLIGISKGKAMKRKGGVKKDQFWVIVDDSSEQVRINSPRILINLRDEAHRFALKHHRGARKFHKKKSILDSIKGIGPTKKKGLIREFGSVEGIKKATVEDVQKVVKNEKLADEIKAVLHE